MELTETVAAVLLASEPYEVHGQRNWRLVFRRDGGDAAEEILLGQHSVHGDPRAGDRVRVRLVMGQAVEVTPEDAG